MQVLQNIEQIKKFYPAHSRVFIPTMGAIHDGHLSLIDKAKESINTKKNADKIIVSIFVNPLQMDSPKSFQQYPRSLDKDCEKLAKKKVDAVFAPNIKQIYPIKQNFLVSPIGNLGSILEGRYRKLHFQGVTTVLAKFFNIVKPAKIILGQKDYQQMLLVKQMVAALNYDIKVTSAPTKRDENGLALSSRNTLLTSSQLKEAPRLFKILQNVRHKIQLKAESIKKIEQQAFNELNTNGWKTDYITIRSAKSLSKPAYLTKKPLIVLTAATLGKVRLIDNLLIN